MTIIEIPKRVNVLDYGFVELRNMAGPTRRTDLGLTDGESWRFFDADDTDVANSARMSFDASDAERTYDIEMKLNRYLAKNRHMTPFESIEVWLEMKLPIFVARQFVRHRTSTINEVSGRYVTLPAEWYIPETVGAAPKDKKQGASVEPLDADTSDWFKKELDCSCRDNYNYYTNAIKFGVAPEHARLFLHVNHYTHWLWKQDLRNLFGFLALRDHPHAQIEAQLYARAILALLEPHLPGLTAIYKEIFRAT